MALVHHFFVLVCLLFFPPNVKSLNFFFPDFSNPSGLIVTKNDSFFKQGRIELTNNDADDSLQLSVGRASYNKSLYLWDTKTRELTSFSTSFSFQIHVQNSIYPGDGMTFFLAAPFESSAAAPPNSAGGGLGLSTYTNNTFEATPFVAVEFDTFPNAFDPIPAAHVAIDVNTVANHTVYDSCEGIGNTSTPSTATITYDSKKLNLSILLTYSNHPPISLSSIIDLRDFLPSRVRVGFSASTGGNVEFHKLYSWEFNSTLVEHETPVPSPIPIAPKPAPVNKGKKRKKKVIKAGLVAGGIVVIVLSLAGYVWWRRRLGQETDDDIDSIISDDFESRIGPKRFSYDELCRATNNYADERKLGEGGFGGVFFGVLKDPTREIAVKKVSKGSRQGKKEYVSEVKIISRLRHKNLVQLLGWCHEKGNLLLAYEFLPNGSLDSHLYRSKRDPLPWIIRHKVSVDLASALLYLHEDWEQCVLHRDIKSSNVMLDSNFNAKLGDFGLARLVDHSLGSQTTVLAGTLGYLAPECATTGKASKESDVYSFGVVALEIACGRRPIEAMEEPAKVRLIDWVWNLYGKGLLFEAADRRLEGEFDVDQIECLMIVGLWCCHPDDTLRPSISQVIKVLKSEAPLPNLPSTIPVPFYSLIPARMDICSFPSSSTFTGSSGTTDSSSHSLAAGIAPLLPEKTK